jgi:hypothetical protein
MVTACFSTNPGSLCGKSSIIALFFNKQRRVPHPYEPMDHVPYRLNKSEITKEAYRHMVMELAHDHQQQTKAG